MVGEMAPDFAFTLADGTTQKLSDLRGKKVLINFWATWCPPCMAEMPDIQEAADTYENEGFVVLAVNSAEEQAKVEAFAEEYNLTIPLITNRSGDISMAYGARNLPTSFFLNTDGTISYRQIGIMDKAFIETRLENMQ
jgi:peroxiredoxin